MNRRLELTRGRIIALIIGIPLSLAVISGFVIDVLGDLASGTQPVRFDLPAHGRAVTVSVEAGDLRLTTSADGRVKLDGIALYSLFRPLITSQSTGPGIVLTSHCHISITRCEFDYHLALPAGGTANLTDGSGDITGSGLVSRDLTAVSHAGNITLKFAVVPDHVDVTTSFGNITLVLPPGRAAYRVDASAPFGTSTIRVPTSPASRHVLTVSDTSGSITIKN
ncbi:MAG TPA: DUF4097 family beta strand repeat-containing protein [Streptosporangiaceae bacterium]|nr:DUF4097 family beta strand repeat-containing protein [Streptosporangiaceae bacterium]